MVSMASKLGAMEQRQPICHHLDARLSASRGGRSMSCTRTLVETRAPASRQTRAAALSNGNPRRPSSVSHLLCPRNVDNSTPQLWWVVAKP